jgi:hypothetical protein
MPTGLRTLRDVAVSAAVVLAGGCGHGAIGPEDDAGPPQVRGPLPAGCLELLPQTVAFGNVEVHSVATRSVEVTNDCGVDLPGIILTDLQGTDPQPFHTIPAAHVPILLRDKETVSVTVQYTPLAVTAWEDRAYFGLQACAGGTGCWALVALRGMAVATGLSVAPQELDFGFVPAQCGPSLFPPAQILKVVTLSNVANVPIQLTAHPLVLNLDSSGALVAAGAFQPGAGFPVKGTVIFPNQSIQVPVGFRPPTIDKFSGELDISTNDATNANLKIPLTGFGGGAQILCSPSQLDFGVVGGVGIASTWSILCTNIG